MLYWLLNVKVGVCHIQAVLLLMILLLLNCVEIVVIRLLLYRKKCANLILQCPKSIYQRSHLIFDPLLLRHRHTSSPLSRLLPAVPPLFPYLNDSLRYHPNPLSYLFLCNFDPVHLFIYLRCPRLQEFKVLMIALSLLNHLNLSLESLNWDLKLMKLCGASLGRNRGWCCGCGVGVHKRWLNVVHRGAYGRREEDWFMEKLLRE